MSETQAAALRRFNRVVTERIGALNDEYLSRSRALGASRVLWEIGTAGTDARSLRSRLGLDSGYLSRLLRSLEDEGLIVVTQLPSDTRVRAVHLTEVGLSERAVLDRTSNELAASLLASLDAKQRAQLIDAAGTVERLLTAGMIQIAVEDPASADAAYCIGQYFIELDTRFEAGFDPTLTNSVDLDELTDAAGLLLLARLRDEPIGCGALRLHGREPAEIKRMWVSSSARGLGLGRRLLTELERHAAARGVSVVRLDTNQSLVEAISLYESAGYEEVTAFNDEHYAHHWFEKRLDTP